MRVSSDLYKDLFFDEVKTVILYSMGAEKSIISDAKEKLSDILTEVSWREIARTYFGKSSSWLYHKLNGVKSDGSEGGGFSEEEAIQLRDALLDLSARISRAAQSL